jgi:hypothetical protein
MGETKKELEPTNVLVSYDKEVKSLREEAQELIDHGNANEKFTGRGILQALNRLSVYHKKLANANIHHSSTLL